ncbi:MAG: hypothetical protein JXA87_07510 [Thermoleophilia bacterium]|nr:hypothetical protein [Thermoleophilia bacterium]
MTDRYKDDTNSGSATGERERRQKRVLPKPLLRLLIILAAIIIAVVVIVVVARNVIRSGESTEYQTYMDAVAGILEESDAVGVELVEMLTDPGDTNRTEIQSRLDGFRASGEQLQVRAEGLEAPNDLVESGIHQFFLLVMSFRKTGMTELKPALMNALEVEDTDVTSEGISRALYYLTNSDFLYKEVFVPRAKDLLAKKELTGVSVPTSQFFSDPDLASNAQVLHILAGLESAGNLQAVHGVELTKVLALPDDKEIKAGGTFNLTADDELAFEVSVENQGNMDEKKVKVTITLLSSDSPEPQKVVEEIPLIKAKQTAKVKVQGVTPTPYGEMAVIKIEAGPVPDEKYRKNNVIEANVIFKM